METMNLQNAHYQISSLKIQLEEAKNTVKLKDLQLNSKASMISNLEQSTKILKNKIERLQEKIKELSKPTLPTLTPTPNSESQLNFYKREIQAKDDLITEAQANISAYVQTVSGLTSEVTDLRLKVKIFENELESKDIQIKQLKQANANHQISVNNSQFSIQSDRIQQVDSFNPQLEQDDEINELEFPNMHQKMVKEVDNYSTSITNLKEKIRFLSILSAVAENKLDEMSEAIMDEDR